MTKAEPALIPTELILPTLVLTPSHVISFWRTVGPRNWISSPPWVDVAIEIQFGELHGKAVRGELDHWADTAEGAYALIVLLDQFSRNMYREDGRAYESDAKARSVADAALAAGFDKDPMFHSLERKFFYLPFMHSERCEDQHRSIELFLELGDPVWVVKAMDHAAIVFAYGRYPHRNPAMKRANTIHEERFAKFEDRFWR